MFEIQSSSPSRHRNKHADCSLIKHHHIKVDSADLRFTCCFQMLFTLSRQWVLCFPPVLKKHVHKHTAQYEQRLWLKPKRLFPFMATSGPLTKGFQQSTHPHPHPHSNPLSHFHNNGLCLRWAANYRKLTRAHTYAHPNGCSVKQLWDLQAKSLVLS